MKSNFNFLHEKALQCVATYLRAESDLIAILQKIDDCHGFREIGFKSLFEYATQGLKLSESVSYNLITVARKSREVPKLQEMIQAKEISVSNARMIAPVLTLQNQETLLTAAASLSKRELEKEIAKEFPEKRVVEKTKYISETRLEVRLSVSEKLNEKLKRIQDLVSSQTGDVASLEIALEAMADLYLEKKDPIEKAKRAEARVAKDDSLAKEPVPAQVKGERVTQSQNPHRNDSRYIPAKIAHQVRLRDEGQCTARTPSGTRCQEKRWLDIHHIKPISKGGVSVLDNLTLLCRGHHQILHLNREIRSTKATFSEIQKLASKKVMFKFAL